MLSVSCLKQSKWSLLLCVLAALALAVMPLGVSAKVYLSGGDDLGGDPVDSNDLGGAGSGSDDDIHDALNVTPIPTRTDPPTVFGFYVFIVPSRTSAFGFEFLFLTPMALADAEGAYAR